MSRNLEFDENMCGAAETGQKQLKLFVETFGCQMNVNDSEVVVSVMRDNGFVLTADPENADVILMNTCAIRENAEKKALNRLMHFIQEKRKRPGLKVGVIGCMAAGLKEKLKKNGSQVDIIAGPDSYRQLPSLIQEADGGQQAVNILLSREETYADISPVRMDKNGVSSFVSIMRGCNNFCSYCVVPRTRGRERSRNPHSVFREVEKLAEQGYREVTLLGQNVNSYRWKEESTGKEIDFAGLISRVASVSMDMRVRFSTSHPKDISDRLLYTIAEHNNICRHIHLPVQSGSTRILNLMNRGYSRKSYLERVNAAKKIIPGCSVSTDIIAGFCSETEEDHHETMTLMEEAGFDFAFMFKYSERPGTAAAKNLPDDVAGDVKTRRLNEIIELQNRLSSESNKKEEGKTYTVLAEGKSKKSPLELFGRTSHNKVAVFPEGNIKPGDYADIVITGYTSATLIGRIRNRS